MSRALKQEALAVHHEVHCAEIARVPKKKRPILVSSIIGIALGLGLIAGLNWLGRSKAPPAVASVSSAPLIIEDTQVNPMRQALLALRAGKMYAPAGDNAFEYYLAAREARPDDASVLSGILELVPVVMQGADSALSRNDPAELQRLIGLLERADPTSNNVQLLKDRLAASGILKAREDAALLATAEKAQLAEQQAAAAGVPPTAVPLAAVAPKALPAPAANAGNLSVAAAMPQREIAAPRTPRPPVAKPETPEPARSSASIDPAARPVQQPPASAARVALKLIGAIRPTYPRNALQRRIEGYVDLSFRVEKDGRVGNVRVVNANPKNFFERDAVSAMQRARFEPIEQAQEATRRIEFKQAQG